MPEWHILTSEKVLKKLRTSERGLTKREAAKRLRKYGRNTISIERKISPLMIFLSQFTSMLIIILIASAVILLGLGLTVDPGKFVDAALILAIVVANGIFGFVQDYKAEKSLQALKKLSAPKAWVRRAGKLERLASSALVPGDIIILEEGSHVPADARVIRCSSMEVNESILTGESMPVEKCVAIARGRAALAERADMVFMNTIVARGRGEAVVVATGRNTEVGKIAKHLQTGKEPRSRFQEEMSKLGKEIGIGIMALIVFMAAVLFLMHTTDIIDIFVTSIALAVAAIPEGLPAVVTLSLALGSRRMLRKKTLVRKLPVVESLGSVDIIVTDKTGTLTENRMTVREIWTQGKVIEVTGTGYEEGSFKMGRKTVRKDLEPLLRCGVLCNNAMVEQGYYGDPTEIALLVSGMKMGITKEESEKKLPRIKEMPFTSERKRMTTVHKAGRERIAFMKGAPETVLERCDRILYGGRIRKLDSRTRKRVLRETGRMAEKALRVLGFAYREMPENAGENIEKGMVFLGLQGMMDPPRAGVKEAIDTARKAGIRVIMATGDNALTAKTVARELGIKGAVVEGREIEKMDSRELGKILDATAVFARVSPEHKVRILKALKDAGNVVAMTGDGVNDAPSLEKADVGIAMGIRGTDVAKEASDMVLMDDNFRTIVAAVKEGRTIFENIRKFVNYLLTCNTAEVLVVFLLSLAGWLPVTAVMLLWINLLTDGLPALALGADPPPPGIMHRKPRPLKEGIINKRLAFLIGSIGLEKTAFVAAVFLIGLQQGLVMAQSMTFTAFVMFELVRIGAIRYQERLSIFSNKWLIGAVGASILLQLAVLYLPINVFFGAVPLGIYPWSVIMGITGLGLVTALATTNIVMRLTPHDS